MASALALILAAAGSVAAGDVGSEAEALLEPAKAALEVPLDEQGRIELAVVLAKFQEVTDWTLLMSDETTALVERNSIRASGPLHAEPEAVVRVVEALLAQSNFCWAIARAEPPRLLSVRSLDTTARTTAREDSVNVKAEDLPRFADHMALFVQTIVSLPNTDVRTMSNSLRGMVVDPNALQILPVGDSCELLLQGTGRAVAEVATMLRVLDQRSAAAGAPPPVESLPIALHPAKEGIALGGGGDAGPTMFELVMTYAQATGQLALVSQGTEQILRNTKLWLAGPVVVGAEQFPTFFEELLLEKKLVLTDLLTSAPGLFTVQSLDTAARSTARASARYVDELSLEQCAARPATLFATVIDLPHTDVRTLSNSMRGMVVDPNLVQIVPVGNSSSLLIQGLGRKLVRLREMLAAVDAATAAGLQPVAPEVPEGGGK